jgi:IS1 family transposase
VKGKKNKIWFIYTYHRESGEIVAYVWGRRDLKTAKKQRKRIEWLGISYDQVTKNKRNSFILTFVEDNHKVGKEYTGEM